MKWILLLPPYPERLGLIDVWLCTFYMRRHTEGTYTLSTNI